MSRAGLIALVAVLVVVGAVVFLRSGDGAVCTGTEELTAPSGRVLSLCETVYEVQPSGDTWAVIRAVDAALPADVTTENFGDHDWVCETWGLPALAHQPRPTRIIVQIMQAPFPRGEAVLGISQSIEAYSEQDNRCMWELL